MGERRGREGVTEPKGTMELQYPAERRRRRRRRGVIESTAQAATRLPSNSPVRPDGALLPFTLDEWCVQGRSERLPLPLSLPTLALPLSSPSQWLLPPWL